MQTVRLYSSAWTEGAAFLLWGRGVFIGKPMGKKITISILGNRDFYMELFFELLQAALGTGFNTLTMGDAPLMGSVTDDAQVIAGFQA